MEQKMYRVTVGGREQRVSGRNALWRNCKGFRTSGGVSGGVGDGWK